MSAFGIIVSGRLVQTDFQPVDAGKFLITIPSPESLNHIVVFLTGTSPLPVEMGASVYFSWPDPTSPPTWQYLGYISNDKPSAIFRITKLKNATPANTFAFSQPIVAQYAQIGISCEPLTQIAQLTADITVNPMGSDSLVTYAAKTAENLFNYTCSFARTILPNTNEQYVPLSIIQQWYTNFMRRVEQDPTFMKG
ncbi:protein OPI10 homolog [Panonychus citri]|uniref:protein OPI10 homolog n=1 Tax=Panonychus citri TaxID=50023 RepID=UPI0023081949|nr:protein OPI10 homolog [Panonychus citri]XP_053212518.1 protein OPI10 homolog [Panonychus citri]XP_053214077.1 protein OPI10 homolog [Panonychus citri]